MRFSPFALTVFGLGSLYAQDRPTLTAADYARAEKFLGFNANPLVLNAGVRPGWLAGTTGEFWYRVATARGIEFILVNPARRSRTRAFDQGRLAAALTSAAGTAYDSLRLPMTQLEFATDKQSVTFDAGGRRWTCGVIGDTCTGVTAPRGAGRNAVVSPDGKRAAFIREFNLWVREVETGEETQLTDDGVKDFGYATDNAGWIRSDRPVLLWSPDSRKIATFQHDGRAVGEMYMVESRVNHPVLQAWKYPLPGDSAIFTIHRVVVDLSSAAPRERTALSSAGVRYVLILCVSLGAIALFLLPLLLAAAVLILRSVRRMETL